MGRDVLFLKGSNVREVWWVRGVMGGVGEGEGGGRGGEEMERMVGKMVKGGCVVKIEKLGGSSEEGEGGE